MCKLYNQLLNDYWGNEIKKVKAKKVKTKMNTHTIRKNPWNWQRHC